MSRLSALGVALTVALLGNVAALAPEGPAGSHDKTGMSAARAINRQRQQEARSAVAGFHKRHRFHKQAEIHMTPSMEKEAEDRREADEKAEKLAVARRAASIARKASEKAVKEFSNHMKKNKEEMHAALKDAARLPTKAERKVDLEKDLAAQKLREEEEKAEEEPVKKTPTPQEQAEASEAAREEADRAQRRQAALREGEAEAKAASRVAVAEQGDHAYLMKAQHAAALEHEQLEAQAEQALVRREGPGPLAEEAEAATEQAEEATDASLQNDAVVSLDAARTIQEAEELHEKASRLAGQAPKAPHSARREEVGIRKDAEALRGDERSRSQEVEDERESAEVRSAEEGENQEMQEVAEARKESREIEISPQAAEVSSPPVRREDSVRRPSKSEDLNLEAAARFAVRDQTSAELRIQRNAEAFKRQEQAVQQRLRAMRHM